jgi:hypothetical protein
MEIFINCSLLALPFTTMGFQIRGGIAIQSCKENALDVSSGNPSAGLTDRGSGFHRIGAKSS